MKAKKILSEILVLSMFCGGLSAGAKGSEVNLEKYLDKGEGTYAINMTDNRPFNGAYVVSKDGKLCFRGEFIKPVSGRTGSVNTGIQVFNAGKDLNAAKKGIIKVKANILHEGDKTGTECFATSLGFLNADASKETAYYGGRVYTNKITTQTNKDIKNSDGGYYALDEGWNSVVFAVNTEKAVEKVYLNDEMICPETSVNADISGGCKVWYWAYFGGPRDDSSFYTSDYVFVNYDCEEDIEAAINDAENEMNQCSIDIARDVIEQYAPDEDKQNYIKIIDELQEVLDSSAELSDMSVSYGTLSPAFSKEITEYKVSLPYGSTEVPDVSLKTLSPMAETEVVKADSINGETIITVTSKDGMSKNIYSISYEVEKNTDASIREISAKDCTLSPSFSSQVKDYYINVPYGTSSAPVISVEMNDSNAEYDIVYPDGIGDIIINTLADNGIDSCTYVLHMNVLPPFSIENVLVNGTDKTIVSADVLIDKNFDKPYDIYTSVYRRSGQDIVPLACDKKHFEAGSAENEKHIAEFGNISYSDELSAHVVIDAAEQEEKSETIVVTVDNKVVNHLEALTVNAENVYSKTVQLRIADSSGNVRFFEEIETADNSISKRYIMPDENLWEDGTYTIFIIDGNKYNTVLYELRPLSDDTSLKSVTTQYGDALFSEDKMSYTILVPYGTETIPEVKIETSDKNAGYNLIPAVSVPDRGKIVVTAEDKTEKTYDLLYSWNTNCAYLKELSAAGASFTKAFNKTVMDYEAKLSAGTDFVPKINAISVDPNAKVDISYPSSVKGTAVITVVSQDQTEKMIYRIYFSVKNSSSGGGGGGSRAYSGSGNKAVPNIINSTLDDNKTEPPDDIDSEAFEDISDHWAKNEIIKMKNYGYIKGKDNKKFFPDDNITRAEFCEIIVKALSLEQNDDGAVFDDVPENSWFYNSIRAAKSAEIIGGYGNLFKPDNNISREEMACIIYRTYLIYKTDDINSKSDFEDFDEVSQWAGEAVSAIAGLGIINGKDNNKFEPKSDATRAEAVVIINRLFEKIK
ncbi:MAG: S-layer homology domain-containing protein [Clostridia bacterium]|nr:S-layer homology domain-containing protein [Clostridia bacterium]